LSLPDTLNISDYPQTSLLLPATSVCHHRSLPATANHRTDSQ
jgi:hypothetical protein